MSIFLVLSVVTAAGIVGLEVLRRAASGRRLERSLDALRTLGETIEASFAPLGETIEPSLAQRTPDLATYRLGRYSPVLDPAKAPESTVVPGVSRAS
jgi:hypothetical protein